MGDKMTTKTALSILVINLILVQVTFTKSAASNQDHFKSLNLCKLKDMYNANAPSEKDHELRPIKQLMKIVIFDLEDLALSYIERGKELSNEILKESILKTNTSPEIKKFKEELENFENKYTSCSDPEQLYELVDIFSNATIRYYKEESKGELTSNDKIILNILKKHEVKEMDKEFEEKFQNIFIVNFNKKMNDLKDRLKAEEGEMGEKMLKWWDEVKLLKTADEQIKAIWNFKIF